MTPIDKKQPLTRDETEIYALIERWAIAIRDCDKPNIRADHHDNMLTFNVSPPMSARGIESYTATWDAFFAWFNKPLSFYFHDVDVVAGADVAYATALGNWAGLDPTGKRQGYAFRLTMGLRKFGNKWIVMHEHHSLPVG